MKPPAEVSMLARMAIARVPFGRSKDRSWSSFFMRSSVVTWTSVPIVLLRTLSLSWS